jgi:hypothetical protein
MGEIPIFRNNATESVFVLPTPAGTTVTIRPGMMVKGKHFEKYHGKIRRFVKLSVEEANKVKSKDLQYEC